MSEFQLSSQSAEEAVQQSLERFGPARIALASSFGAEDQVLTDMLVRTNPAARIFTLDTGRVFQETYDTMQRSVEHYHIAYEVCAPDAADLAALIARDGPNLFYSSVENRKACCNVRKMKPLRKVLNTVDAWICGLRREQSITRTAVELVSWDAEFGIYKICPLFDWSEAQGLGLHQEPQCSLQCPARPGLPEHWLRTLHPRRASRRRHSWRTLVVGVARAQRVRTA